MWFKSVTVKLGDANDEQDDDSYLSDRSPRKGKAPASRKHRMKKGKDRDDSPPKRIKTEEPITIDDSDNEIDKDKSSRKAIKAESDVEIDEEKSTPAAIKAETIDLTQVADLEIDDARSSLPAVKAEPIDLSQVGFKFSVELHHLTIDRMTTRRLESIRKTKAKYILCT
jgi:hypothetical protein